MQASLEGRRYALALALILCLAFALRVGAAAAFQGLDSPPDASAQPDQIDYERIAHHLASGQGFSLNGERPTAMRPPGTSWALLPPYLVLGRSFAAGRVWLALISSLSCLAVALFAALWLALYPGSFYYPMHFLSETPYGFWLALAAVGALGAAKQGAATPGALLAGAALGMAALTRPQALLVVPLALGIALLAELRGRRTPRRALLIGTLAFALAIAPWMARNHAHFGKLSLSSIGGCTFWGANNERVLADPALRGSWIEVTALADAEHPLEGGEFEVEAACWRYGLEFLREHPADLPRLALAKLWNLLRPFEPIPSRLAYWIFGLAWILSAPFALAGLVIAWRERRDAALVLLLPLVATLATVLVFYGSGRFRDSVSVLLAAPVGLAFARLVERFARARAKSVAR